VDVSILACTAWRGRLARVRKINVLETSCTCLIARLGAYSENVLVVPVDNNIVCAANGKLIPQSNEVLLRVKGDRALRMNTQELFHVED
jgi:hypothetical protein